MDDATPITFLGAGVLMIGLFALLLYADVLNARIVPHKIFYLFLGAWVGGSIAFWAGRRTARRR